MTSPVATTTPRLDARAANYLPAVLRAVAKFVRENGPDLAAQAAAADQTVDQFVYDGLRKLCGLAYRRLRELPDQITVGPLTIDLTTMSARYFDRDPELTTMELKLLALLAGNAGRVVSRQQIGDEIWPGKPDASASIWVTVGRIRKKLKVGYRTGPIQVRRSHGVMYMGA